MSAGTETICREPGGRGVSNLGWDVKSAIGDVDVADDEDEERHGRVDGNAGLRDTVNPITGRKVSIWLSRWR